MNNKHIHDFISCMIYRHDICAVELYLSTARKLRHHKQRLNTHAKILDDVEATFKTDSILLSSKITSNISGTKKKELEDEVKKLQREFTERKKLSISRRESYVNSTCKELLNKLEDYDNVLKVLKR